MKYPEFHFAQETLCGGAWRALNRHFLGILYAEERDASRLMKYRSIYNELEHTIDKCEDLMNAIESIVLKQT